MPLTLIKDDIVNMKVDAIVNITDKQLSGLSGVDLAIHKAAGPKLDEDCAKLAPLYVGKARITKGYNLPSKYVIHTVSPVWNGGNKDEIELLKSCYKECLKLARFFRIESIAFPLIGKGEYGFPVDKAIKIAKEIITEFLKDNELNIYICIHNEESFNIS